MQKLILTLSLFLFGIAAFSQDIKKNGTIYIKHPYIDTVLREMNYYLTKNDAANKNVYSDTCKFWTSGQGKPVNLTEILKIWDSNFDNYDSVKLTKVGYPDYLNYVDMDMKVVQSWWTWSGKSKKTGEWLKIPFVQFDFFNTAGKIAFESAYGDFSKMSM